MHPALATTNPFTTSAASVMRAVEPAAAPVTRPTPAAAAGPIADQTNCIGEIFVGARKIVWADEPPLRDEPIPLFLTQAHIQLDQELTEFIASNWRRRRA